MCASKQQRKRYKQERVTVALTIPANPILLEEAEKRNWQLVYLWHWDNVLPDRMKLHGALVDNLPTDKVVQDLQQRGCACIRLGRLPHRDDQCLLAVLPDQEAEGRLAAEHFAERGFRHVAYWGSNPWGDTHSMFIGFEIRAQELGMACHLHRFTPQEGESQKQKKARSRSEFSQWLKTLPKPIGFFASGDWQAARHSIDIGEAGMHIPDDVSVLSTGNDPNICLSCIPKISSIDRDDEGRLRVACDWLERLMNAERAPNVPLLISPKGVIERESTNILATSDRVVAAALRYMWDYLHHDLSVDRVADEVGLSTSQLQRRFQRALGRSVVQELLRKRLDEARLLLRTTNLSIADIAPKLGFHSESYLHRSFRKAYGMTPTQYRKQQ